MRFPGPIETALGLLYPRICIVCQNNLTTDTWLCGSCIEKLALNHAGRDACPLCGQNRRVRRCTCEYHWQQPFEAAYSLFDFDDTIQSIVHEFKYGGIKRLAFDMGKTYAGLFPSQVFEGMDAITAVPLFFFRFLKRGYNQAEYFAKGLAAGVNGVGYLPDILFRKRHTKTQTKLSRSRRLTNVAGAFTVFPGKKKLLWGKNIIIVDDIITTAATTAECARALMDAGCGKIRVLSLARD